MAERMFRRLGASLLAGALTALIVGCWPSESVEYDDLPFCSCHAEQFRVTIDVQPTRGIASDIVIVACRKTECFERRDGPYDASDSLHFGVGLSAGPGGRRTASLWGNWPSEQPLRSGDRLDASVIDNSDGRTLAATSLTLAVDSYYSSGNCVEYGPPCAILAASLRSVQFPRSCDGMDCALTSLSLDFQVDQVLSETERTTESAYLARACQDARCTEGLLLWTPDSEARAELPSRTGAVAFVLGRDPASGRQRLKAEWSEALGDPGVGNTYSLELHRGTRVTPTSSIVERHGPIAKSSIAPSDCEASALASCASFQWTTP